MWGISNAFQAYLIYLEKYRMILYISVIGMLISLSLNFILVPDMGARGAAIASIITYSAMAIIGSFCVYNYYLKKPA